MRLAMTDNLADAQPGEFVWREVEPGFEVAEMPVVVNGAEVDRLLLNRVDPGRFRFTVRNDPTGSMNIDEWEHALPDEVLIVNSSYYDNMGLPATPIISEGQPSGPEQYDARAGAFVASAQGARLVDLAGQDWKQVFAGAENAMIAYPMLIGADGQTRTAPESRWLANRTFLGQDGSGRIIIGSTKDAFFSLARLAVFLKNAPLDLKLALNLDGGPIASQSVRLEGFTRKHHAKWESQFDKGQVHLLRAPFDVPWALPMTLTVGRK
ncbi:phosphodiester glycosidase family protein [Rhizobium sp. RU36D]|uniref:phosphodiester glycosidase family protein n=1 Tax=Rhizobium sp. RU36D TaxID=1907415 RepID=UPI001FCCF44B|nr:phosphodiester glycosidase family protein [Rhizobium sp. RU36D]